MGGVNSINMDTSIYRNKLWFLIIFIKFEISSWYNSTSVELSFSCIRYGKSIWMVFWFFTHVFTFVDCFVHGFFLGTFWLWLSMASYSEIHQFALYFGQLITFHHSFLSSFCFFSTLSLNHFLYIFFLVLCEWDFQEIRKSLSKKIN